MSDAAESERERIREQKREELRERLADDGANSGAAGGSGSDSTPDGSTHDGSTPDEPIEIGDTEEFQRVVSGHEVVLVDCYADWCGPCQMMEPTVEAVASETDAAVAKVDVDAHPGLAQQLGARGVPTFLVYADGEAVDRFVGAQDRGTLESAMQPHLG